MWLVNVGEPPLLKFCSTSKCLESCLRCSRRSLKAGQNSQWQHSHLLMSTPSSLRSYRPSFVNFFISPPPRGQRLMSPRLFKNLSASVSRLTVLPHILPAPASSADPVIPSSSPVNLAVLTALSASDRPADSLHCLLSLQVYPRRSVPAVDRLCVGVPAAEVSHAAAQSHWLPPGLTQSHCAGDAVHRTRRA